MDMVEDDLGIEPLGMTQHSFHQLGALHPGIVAGNLIGSDLFNMLGVLGLAGVISTLQIHPNAVPSIFMMTVMVLLVMIFMRTGWRLSRSEGLFLVLANPGIR